jgi:ABC-type uncharacterized transport system auxiliary subunit
MRRAMQSAWILVLAAALSECGGARPTKYYVLAAPLTPTSQSAAQFPVALLVARPVTSHLYRDDRIVYGSGPIELGTYEFERWAQSPADMIQDLLVTSLRSSGQYLSVLRPGSSSRGEYVVRSNLRALYEVDKPELVARFALHIDLFDPKTGSTVWDSNYSHDEPVSEKTVAGVVEAMDKNVRAGMQELTTDLGKYFVNHPEKTQAAQ